MPSNRYYDDLRFTEMNLKKRTGCHCGNPQSRRARLSGTGVGLALIAVVGRGMCDQGTSGRIFAALAHANVNVKMIDQGSSELNIIIGVRSHDFDAAINAVYDIL